MGFRCGIVGLPNVGKSTLFNALTQTIQAQAANYPFCTIEPNMGIVGVPDERLDIISDITKSAKIIPTSLEIFDIAGLVKGASKGEGLGNQFLSHIRQTDAIIHVVRCFENEDITHVEGSIHPVRDIEIIETELMLADLESLDKRLQKKKIDKDEQAMLENVRKMLEKGEKPNIADGETLDLMSSKPVLYVCNILEKDLNKENKFVEAVKQYAGNNPVVVVCADTEAQLAGLSEEEQKDYLESIGLQEKGLNQIIRVGYQLLNLITYFTSGPKETRAWTINKGDTAPKAASRIHTDFEKGFIKAEVIAYKDFVEYKGEAGAKDAGKLRVEGKEYVVQDGDIMHFRFNV